METRHAKSNERSDTLCDVRPVKEHSPNERQWKALPLYIGGNKDVEVRLKSYAVELGRKKGLEYRSAKVLVFRLEKSGRGQHQCVSVAGVRCQFDTDRAAFAIFEWMIGRAQPGSRFRVRSG